MSDIPASVTDSIASPFAFSGGGSSTTSLDSKLVHQTKSEIRALANEIAGLAASEISQAKFLEGFLPRLKLAMGASASAVWRIDGSSQGISEQAPFHLVAHQTLQQELLNDDLYPSHQHRDILRSALVEAKPILVPPRTVHINADRPANPLDEAIILVPIGLEKQIHYVLEVVQPSAGGPAAQRGYLRFVAQMAELMSDYFRRQRLREVSSELQQQRRLQTWLVRIATADRQSDRDYQAACGLSELLDLHPVFILRSPTQWSTASWRVSAYSGVPEPDARSEVLEAAQQLVCKLASANKAACIEELATNPRGQNSDNSRLQWLNPFAKDGGGQDDRAGTAAYQAELLRVCQLLKCEKLLSVSAASESHPWYLAAVTADSNSLAEAIPWKFHDNAQRLATESTSSLDMLLVHGRRAPYHNAVARSFSLNKPTVASKWIIRGLILALAVVAAWTPLPQRIHVTGTLRAVDRSAHFAPMDAIVQEVLVREGDWVEAMQPLMRLRSSGLESQLDHIRGEIASLDDQLSELQNLRARASNLTLEENDAINAEIQKLETRQRNHKQQQAILEKQERGLEIVAHSAGQVATWNIRNQFLHRPVSKGQLLTTVFEPQGKWQLQLSIPDKRMGLLGKDNGSTGLAKPLPSLRFHLTSHPQTVLDGQLVQLATQALPDIGDPTRASILALADIDETKLPLREDGTVVHATLDCGRVPAIWLILRDAVSALRAQVRMLF